MCVTASSPDVTELMVLEKFFSHKGAICELRHFAGVIISKAGPTPSGNLDLQTQVCNCQIFSCWFAAASDASCFYCKKWTAVLSPINHIQSYD